MEESLPGVPSSSFVEPRSRKTRPPRRCLGSGTRSGLDGSGGSAMLAGSVDEDSKDSGVGFCSDSAPRDFASAFAREDEVAPSCSHSADVGDLLNDELHELSIEERSLPDPHISGEDLSDLDDEDICVSDCEDAENLWENSGGSPLKSPIPELQPTSQRRGLADLTNRLSADTSPLTSKKPCGGVGPLPVRKYATCFFGGSSAAEHSSTRKRSIQERSSAFKRSRPANAAGLHPAVPSSSQFAAPVLPAPIPPRRSRAFHRVHSSSVLLEEHSRHQLSPQLDVSYSLDCVSRVDSQAFRRISSATLAGLFKSLSLAEFQSRFHLVDCRYPYEYSGGHIITAMNLFDPSELEATFFCPEYRRSPRIPIFYCEFSQKRGPSMANALRSLDRLRNELNYPEVDFAEMYVLEKGYSEFHELYGSPSTCSPHAYVRMVDSTEVANFPFHKRSFSAAASVCRQPKPKQKPSFLRQQSATAELSPSSEFLGSRVTRRSLLFTPPSHSASTSSLNNPDFS